MTTTITKESLAARIADLESGARSLKEDYTLAAYKMLLATMASEPDRNPVLTYADSYRDMAKQGVESVPIWSVITDLERNIAPLYRHAQPAPVVPGKWIPVSERKPENKPGSYEYLVFETLNNRVNHDYWNVPSEGDDAFTPFWNHYSEHVTHWMPLPAGPVK